MLIKLQGKKLRGAASKRRSLAQTTLAARLCVAERKTKMKITKESLKKANACRNGLTTFTVRWPKGCTWDECCTWLREIDQLDWLKWLGQWCPAGVEGSTWAVRLALQCNDDERAVLGRYCPAGVEGSTFDARLALMRNDDERAVLGQYCPADVEGSTFIARLALMRNDDERAYLARNCPDGVEGKPK